MTVVDVQETARPLRRGRRSGWRGAAYRATAVLLGCGLSLAMGETVVRLLDLPPKMLSALYDEKEPYYVLSDNPVLRYEHRRNFAAGDDYRGDHRGFQTNSAGFRDREYPRSKPPGTTRILVLGDSVTAGKDVPQLGDVYTEQLEEILNSTGGGGAEVINMGVGGYDTQQEVELLRVRGLDFDPDIVLVGLCLNDLWRNLDGGVFARLTAQLYDSERQALARTHWRNSRWLNECLGRSRFLFFAFHRCSGLLNGGGRRASRQGYFEWLGQYGDDSRNPVEVGFAELDRLRREKGFRVIVFIIPGFDRPFSMYAHLDIHRQVQAFARSHPELRVIDLMGGFQNLGDNAAPFTTDGLHLNARGHAVLATLIAEHLRSELARSD